MFARFALVILFTVQTLAAQTIRLPVTEDNSIVMVDGEWKENAGTNGRIRIKGNQHVVAMAFDTTSIAGKKIAKATLVCAQGESEISGVSVSTIATPWDESRSNALWCGRDGIVDWGYPGARFPAVCGGNGFTLVHHVKSELRDGTYYWEIPSDFVHAMAIGCAFGLALHEHDADYNRNPTIFSREQSGKKPFLLVELDQSLGRDLDPEPPTDLQLKYAGDDSLRLSLRAPEHGFAYDVSVDGVALGRHNIPLVQPGSAQTIPIRDLPAPEKPAPEKPNQPTTIRVTTINRLGKRAKPVEISSAPRPKPTIRSPLVKPAAAVSPAITDVGIIPITDKLDSAGMPVGKLPSGYLTHNTIYNGQRVHLTGAAGEVLGFQLLLKGKGNQSIKVGLSDLKARIDLFQAVYVAANGRMIPDPLLPLPKQLPLTPESNQTIVADIYIPFETAPGKYIGFIEISDGRMVPMEVEVMPFSIPREATFFCEMNGYGLPDDVRHYYSHQRIAYDHRTHANILHYSHNTAAPGSRKSNLDMRLLSGRRMDNKRYDDIAPDATQGFWDDFAEAFGPFLDGSLFADGHRGPIAAPGFYLTFHESWPLNCRAYFNGNPDAYLAFSDQPAYARTYRNLLQDFAKLAESKAWTQCRFQVYFNNKGSLNELAKAPWILDEPSSFWDYRALQFFGELTDRGTQNRGTQNRTQATINYRVDISRPEYCRGQLNGRSDLWVVSASAFEQYRRLVTDRIEQDRLQVWVYGTSNHVHQSNRNIQGWALNAWKDGANGIVPWQTVNKTGSALREADQLGLFIYDSDSSGNLVIHHSLRLKAYREAQQLIEYLNLLKTKTGWSQEQMRQFMQQYTDLSVQVQKVDEADAGTSGYGNLTAQEVEQLRQATAKLLSDSVEF